MSRRVSIFGASFSSAPVFQAETIAYMNALGIAADGTIYYPSTTYERTGLQLWSYVNTFVIVIKAIGWAKFRAIWLRIGGTAARHSINLINPMNTDAAHRLTYFGGLTHSATGELPNGTNGYANTHINPFSHLSLNDTHICFYSRTANAAANIIEMEATDFGFTQRLILTARFTGDLSAIGVNSGAAAGSNNDSSGLFFGERGNSANMQLYRNKSLLLNSTTASTVPPNIDLTLYRRNRIGVPADALYSNRESCFGSVGSYLGADRDAFEDAIQALQTSLGRQV